MRRPLFALAAVLVVTGSSACSDDHQGIRSRDTGASATATPDEQASTAPTRTPSPTPSATPTPVRRSASPSARPAAAGRYVFPIHGCRTSYGHSHHDYPATDVFAAKGCKVVSPVDGVVDEVSTVDRWDPATNRGADRGGLSFSVVGADGVRYYGSHLNTVVVRPGQRVIAGQKVGTVGSTGSARGTSPHLHVGLSWPTRHGVWWVRRGEVSPWRYLDSWKTLNRLSPAREVAAAHRRLGDIPPCSVNC